jgi:hypothetical protein
MRLYAASLTLAQAQSHTWSLATWAQLEWVRRVLDGDDFVGPISSPFPELRGYSFVRLLKEYAAVSTPNEAAAAADAIRDGSDIIGVLTAVSAKTEKPEDILAATVDKIRDAKGLLLFTKGFPKYKSVETED